MFKFGNVQGGDVETAVFVGDDIVYELESRAGDVIPDEKAVPLRATVVHVKVARGDSEAVPLQFGEVVLAGEGGDVGRPDTSEGLMKAEKDFGGEEVDVFVGAAVKTKNFATHGGENFFPVVPVGYKIEVGKV